MKLTDALLIAAVALGILIALAGLADVANAPLGDAIAATVNETPITADELRSRRQRRAQEGAPGDQLRGALDDMIDEELLIQRASELGILRRDSNVRVAIIQAMEKSILSEERGRTFSDAEIEAFHRDNTAVFAEPLRLQLEEIIVVDTERVASLAAELTAGAAAAALAADTDGVSMTRLPPVPLSLEAWARRVPEDIVSQLETAGEGDVLEHESSRGVHLLRVASIRKARTPPLDEVRVTVLNELQMRRQDVAYAEYLAWLRQRADIRKNERAAL